MGKKQSLRSKAAYFVSDLTTVLLNPISDNKSPSLPLSVSIHSLVITLFFNQFVLCSHF